MKKFLFLVLLVLAFFTIDHPLIKEPRDKLLNRGVSKLSEASKMQHNKIALDTQKEIANVLTLSMEEEDYLAQHLDTETHLKTFHQRFCKDKELNPHFVGDRLLKLCQATAEGLKKMSRY